MHTKKISETYPTRTSGTVTRELGRCATFLW
jgi:hypothetical protein